MQVARITLDIVRPLPIAELRVTTRLLRGGRSLELVEATLRAGEVELMRATALRIRTAELDLPGGLTPGPRLAGPEAGRTVPFFPTGQDVGYHTAMEARFVAGSFLELGPATVWMRMRHPLLPGEPPSPLCRVLVAADSGNGVSAALDYQQWRFVNADLTVYLFRPPAGEWVALESTTTAAAGIGLADTTLHDEQGPIGHSAQALFVDRRQGPQ
jgi:Thioesterase-like superfamily